MKKPRKNCRYCKGTGLYIHRQSKLYNTPCICINNNPLFVPTTPNNTREPVRKIINSKDYLKKRADILYNDESNEALQVVDIDMIKSLRLRGLYEEADKLIKEHQRTIKENISVGKERNKLISQNIIRKNRRKRNLCTTCGKEKENSNYVKCNACLKRHREYIKKDDKQ